jgi:hypothetical protein
MGRQGTYKVVKFIVNVRLMEKSVKSHVGRVMVVKVMIQYRVPGSTRRTVRMARARKPNVEGVCSAAWRAATADGRTLGAFGELLVTALTVELAASAAMVLWQASGRSFFEVAMA